MDVDIFICCCFALLCLLAGLISFLYRNGGGGSSVIYVNNTPQYIIMNEAHLPFKISLDICAKDSSLQSGITCFITTHEHGIIQAFWNVLILDVLDLINSDLPIEDNVFLDMLKTGEVLKSAQCKGPIVELPFQSAHSRFVPPEVINPHILGEHSRIRIPLVLVLFRPNGIPRDHPTFVLSVFFLHLKDDLLPIDSYIIQHVAKLSTGETYAPKLIYAPGSSDEGTVCVICLDNYAQYVLLPCRHHCICRSCFRRQPMCPVCRSYVHYYFKCT